MSAGLPSGLGIGCSAARAWTVLMTVTANSASDVSPMDERSNALRVMGFCFIFVYCSVISFLGILPISDALAT
jgi:hypothetical protein